MTGTFYILSGFTGDTNYMTWTQLHSLANEGNEIAGHTIDHTELTSGVRTAQAVRMTVDVTSYSSGDEGLTVDQDQGTCSPSVTVGQTYVAGVAHKSTATATLTVWYRNSFGSWNCWTSGPDLPAASTASFTTPAVPSGATAVSFGLTIAAVGSLSTGNYSLGTTP